MTQAKYYNFMVNTRGGYSFKWVSCVDLQKPGVWDMSWNLPSMLGYYFPLSLFIYHLFQGYVY